jgi:glyoxalase-like protein
LPGDLWVDHLAHFVPDLDAAARLLQKLGLSSTPVSHHQVSGKPAGTANRCVMLEQGYLEILCPTLYYDNPLAETIIGLCKAEVIHRRGPWRHAEAVEFATLEWVDWFNNRRLLEPIGEIPPVEFEQAYYRSNEPHAMVA